VPVPYFLDVFGLENRGGQTVHGIGGQYDQITGVYRRGRKPYRTGHAQLIQFNYFYQRL
jgi:hypothetical protein